MMNYTKPNMDIWTGRIDDEKNYNAFRWHQWVKPLNLMDETISLDSNQAGVAFIGFLSDEGVRRNLGRPGAVNGPKSIRKELCNLPCSFSSNLKLFDAGDICCEDNDLETAQKSLSLAVSKIMDMGLFPLVLGGGHEVALGTYMGIKTKTNLGIINFDAHFDIRPYKNGASSGTMFRQIADYCKLNELPFNYYCIGIQKRGNTVELFNTADALGIEYLLAKDIEEGALEDAFASLDNFIEKQESIYVTICSDVFSSAFAPGVSAVQPLGLHPSRVLKFFDRIFTHKKVIAMDIAEVSPRYDQDNITSNLAATFIFAAVNSIASNNIKL